MKYPVRNGNRVKFLLDGEEILKAMNTGFKAVARAALGTPDTYVRMGFWVIAHDIKVGDLNDWQTADSDFIRLIRNVLLAGHNVQLILWYPNNKIRTAAGASFSEQVDEHDRIAATLNDMNNSLIRGGRVNTGRAMVYRERYEGWTGGSQHQKIAIFSVNGQRTVVLGGLNMAHRYFDNTVHDIRLGGNNTNWHDTGIEYVGPITDDIEDEWMRRWRKVIAIADATIPTERLYNHLTAPGVTDQWKKAGAAALAENTTVQRQQNFRVVPNAFYQVPAQIGLTLSTKTTRTTEIRDRMIELIQGATRRIYLENNQFTDPDLVRALYRRKQQRPGLQIVIVTNPSSGGVGYLTRRAWLHLALRSGSCRSLTYFSEKDPNHRKTLLRGAGPDPAWTVHDNYTPNVPTWHQWLEADCVRIQKTSGGRHLVSTKDKKFHQITDVDVDFHFLTPVTHEGWIDLGGGGRYWPNFRTLLIHSKLAVIDDYVCCGTSNWTYRSMQYDGEMTGFAQDNGFADHVLDRLLGHFDTVNNATHLSLGNLGTTARQAADFYINEAAGARRDIDQDRWTLLPLEYRRIDLGLSLAWDTAQLRQESPAHGWIDRIQNFKKRIEGLKRDLPNWTWW